jgi:SAM-dependent methyltransferase
MELALHSDARLPYELKPSPYSSHSLLLAALPAPGGGRRVLDLGCAAGYLSELLSGRGYRVTGVDRAESISDHFPASVELILADLDQGLPTLSTRFSHVVCADILEHLREPERLLAAIPKVLERSGGVIASLPNSGNIYFRLNVLLGRFPQHDRGLFDRTHLHFYTWDGWVDLFRRGGFRIESVRPTGIPVSLALPRWSDAPVVRIMERLCYELARFWQRLFAYQFVVIARPEPSV